MYYAAMIIEDGYKPIYFIVNGADATVVRKTEKIKGETVQKVWRFRNKNVCIGVVEKLNKNLEN